MDYGIKEGHVEGECLKMKKQSDVQKIQEEMEQLVQNEGSDKDLENLRDLYGERLQMFGDTVFTQSVYWI